MKNTPQDICLIRTDASEKTGMGHFYRCLALSDLMEKYGFLPCFAVKYITDSIPSILSEKQIRYITMPAHTSWDKEIEILEEYFQERPAAVLLDLSHSLTFSHLDGFSDYTKALRKVSPVSLLIDGFKTSALIEQVEMDVDIVVTPYYCAETLLPNSETGLLRLAGHKYMVFPPEYAYARDLNRKIADNPDKVLVTFGGSDPYGITTLALRGLDLIRDRVLDIHVVIGPNYAPEFRNEIREIIHSFSHNITVIESPPSLAESMTWCDLAISASGLTKYELALTGTPAILISIDREHAEINNIFDKAGTSLHLGRYSNLTAEKMKDAVLSVLNSKQQREEISYNGLHLMGMDGADSILINMRRLCDER